MSMTFLFLQWKRLFLKWIFFGAVLAKTSIYLILHNKLTKLALFMVASIEAPFAFLKEPVKVFRLDTVKAT